MSTSGSASSNTRSATFRARPCRSPAHVRELGRRKRRRPQRLRWRVSGCDERSQLHVQADARNQSRKRPLGVRPRHQLQAVAPHCGDDLDRDLREEVGFESRPRGPLAPIPSSRYAGASLSAGRTGPGRSSSRRSRPRPIPRQKVRSRHRPHRRTRAPFDGLAAWPIPDW